MSAPMTSTMVGMQPYMREQTAPGLQTVAGLLSSMSEYPAVQQPLQVNRADLITMLDCQ